MTTTLDKPWTRSYDADVPPSLQPYPEITLYTLLDETVAAHPEHPAVISSRPGMDGERMAQVLSYRELGEQSDQLAGALYDRGVHAGDRVALDFANSAQFVLAFFAILKAGGVVVALNPTFPPARKAEQLTDSGVVAAVVMTDSYAGLNDIRKQTGLRHMIISALEEYLPETGNGQDAAPAIDLHPSDAWLQDVLASTPAEQRPQVAISPEDTAVFQYTGGTTSVPKAACGPHRALVANARQISRWLEVEADGTERFLAAIPLFHVYGMVGVMTLAAATASAMIMVSNPRDLDELLGSIDAFKPTIFMGVPSLYNAINAHPDAQAGRVDLSSLRACVSGSAPLAAETKRRFEAISGGTVLEGFGMSETPTATHINPLHGENRTGSIGLPLPDVECRIVDLVDGVTDVPIGEVGELLIRGPVMMTGYHNMPEETANAIRDGWLYTGDIARMDADGYFSIVDRKKDMVIVGGFKVYPNQVERVLMAHPGVAEAAVAGIPHPEKEGQEAVKAWIVQAAGSEVTREELIAHCQEVLAPYEVPWRMAFVEALPRSLVGKVLRRELVRQETAGMG